MLEHLTYNKSKHGGRARERERVERESERERKREREREREAPANVLTLYSHYPHCSKRGGACRLK